MKNKVTMEKWLSDAIRVTLETNQYFNQYFNQDHVEITKWKIKAWTEALDAIHNGEIN